MAIKDKNSIYSSLILSTTFLWISYAHMATQDVVFSSLVSLGLISTIRGYKTNNKNQILKKIDESGELYNSNKEYIDKNTEHNCDLSLLVLQKDDVNARMKYESLSIVLKLVELIKSLEA